MVYYIETQKVYYKETPCDCGFTQLDNSNEFELYMLPMGTYMGKSIGKKPVTRCKNCHKISVIEIVEELPSKYSGETIDEI